MPDPTDPTGPGVYITTVDDDGKSTSVLLDPVTGENFISASNGERPLTGRDRRDLDDLDDPGAPQMFGVRHIMVPDPPREPWPEFEEQVRDALREARSND